ncbi:MAG: hypothetical protein WDN04_22575 [Rhodospirillales bacterium]
MPSPQRGALVDAKQARRRIRAAHHDAMQHARRREIVDVLPAA